MKVVMTRGLLVIAVVLSLGTAPGCGDDGLGEPQSEDPVLVIEPQRLDFTAGENGELSVSFRNEGAEQLHIWDVDFSTLTSNSFRKGQNWPSGDIFLEYGESHEFTVRYQPVDDAHMGTVNMITNDPERPTASVLLSVE